MPDAKLPWPTTDSLHGVQAVWVGVLVAVVILWFGSENLVHWVTCTWEDAQRRIPRAIRQMGCRPRSRPDDWFQHVSRERNVEAETFAHRHGDACVFFSFMPWPRLLNVKTDGGSALAGRDAVGPCGVVTTMQWVPRVQPGVSWPQALGSCGGIGKRLRPRSAGG